MNNSFKKSKNQYNRQKLGWIFYDFANSSYTTVVLTAIFNAYFVSIVAENKHWATLLWTTSLSISYFLVIITAPIIARIADRKGYKKKFLLISTFGCFAFTFLLGFIERGDIYLAFFLIIFSNFFFATGENLISAFLPRIAKTKNLGKVSGLGWGFGYIGGLASLGLCLTYIYEAEKSGLKPENFVPNTMFLIAFFFIISSVPTFIFLKEKKVKKYRPIKSEKLRLFDIIKTLNTFSNFKYFLFSIVFFQSGVQAIVVLAAVYANQVMNFNTNETLLLIFIVNISAFLGAIVVGFLQDKFGHVKIIFCILIIWFFTIIFIYFIKSVFLFWIAANFVGFALGSCQSCTRGFVAYLSPKDRTAEFFSYWGIAVKISAIIGPMTYGVLTWVYNGNHKLSILSLALFFFLGTLYLLKVNEKEGRDSATRSA